MSSAKANTFVTEEEDETDEVETSSSGKTVYDDSYTAAELKAAAKDAGIKGYSAMTKAELIEALNT